MPSPAIVDAPQFLSRELRALFLPNSSAEAGEARPLKTRGDLARRLREGKELPEPALALKMLKVALTQGFPALYLLVDAWFTAPNSVKGPRTWALTSSAT